MRRSIRALKKGLKPDFGTVSCALAFGMILFHQVTAAHPLSRIG
jgi:hypothetical protein